MKNGLESRRRQFVLNEGYSSLEDRVLMSTIGRSTLASAPAHIDVVTHGSHATVGVSHTTAERVARVGGPLLCRTRSAVAVLPTVKRWSWLANTYWYVPTNNLPAVLYDSSTGILVPISDQTVYHIAAYRNGYFWGNTVSQLGSSPASNSFMVGSVTPEGKVLLTFTSASGTSSPSITEGTGKMQKKYGQWTMENQMFTSPNETLQIGHWAYMLQTRPGMASWNSLPGVGVSVPEFLSQ